MAKTLHWKTSQSKAASARCPAYFTLLLPVSFCCYRLFLFLFLLPVFAAAACFLAFPVCFCCCCLSAACLLLLLPVRCLSATAACLLLPVCFCFCMSAVVAACLFVFGFAAAPEVHPIVQTRYMKNVAFLRPGVSLLSVSRRKCRYFAITGDFWHFVELVFRRILPDCVALFVPPFPHDFVC